MRMERVSLPWFFFTSAQRCRPTSVLGPVETPPWNLHLVFPFDAGARHCCLVRFDLALHWRQVIRPPAVVKVKLFDINLDLNRASYKLSFLLTHRTSWTEPDKSKSAKCPNTLKWDKRDLSMSQQSHPPMGVGQEGLRFKVQSTTNHHRWRQCSCQGGHY